MSVSKKGKQKNRERRAARLSTTTPAYIEPDPLLAEVLEAKLRTERLTDDEMWAYACSLGPVAPDLAAGLPDGERTVIAFRTLGVDYWHHMRQQVTEDFVLAIDGSADNYQVALMLPLSVTTLAVGLTESTWREVNPTAMGLADGFEGWLPWNFAVTYSRYQWALSSGMDEAYEDPW